MQFLVPAATRKKDKYGPRHFRALAESFSDAEWLADTAAVTPGDWAMVVRSPGYRGLGRSTASSVGMESAFDILNPQELEAAKSKGGRIIVDLGWEMLNPAAEIVTSLHDTLRDLSIDPTRVFIFHSNQNARGDFNRNWLQIAGTRPPCTLEYPVAVALCVIHQQKTRDEGAISRRHEETRKRTTAGDRSRLFVSFNGEVRPHRLYMGAALQQLGLLERGYFSLIYPRKSAKETDEQFRQRSLKTLGKLPRGRDFVDAGAEILDMLPLELDIGAVAPAAIESIAWVSQDPKFYDDSRFTIVVDTALDPDRLFVTEKVLKPIMNHSPFLLVGSEGGADLMRRYGFQTFEPYIRQCEAGGADVLTQAVDEIQRLARLSERELDELSKAVASICDYNAAHFWGPFPKMLKNMFEECLSTLGPPLSVA